VSVVSCTDVIKDFVFKAKAKNLQKKRGQYKDKNLGPKTIA